MLSSTQIDEFVERGHVRVEGAIPREVALGCRDLAHSQLGLNGPPWPTPVVRGVVLGPYVRDAARSPRLVAAIAQLLAGESWRPRQELGLFVVRLPSSDDPGDAGWHIDASYRGPETDGLFSWYVNHRSRGRGLLLLCLLSDVGPDDAPTRILDGSHRKMPALLEPLGEDGVMGLMAPLPEPTGDVSLATGPAGDVYLCHPFLVHAASWPHRGSEPRVIAQPAIELDGDLRLDASATERSAVARAISQLQGGP